MIKLSITSSLYICYASTGVIYEEKKQCGAATTEALVGSVTAIILALSISVAVHMTIVSTETKEEESEHCSTRG